jgi:murein DD-endopeptidase MepM/ murein hydrolase activator NlpD
MRRPIAPRAEGWTPRRPRLAVHLRHGSVPARLVALVLVVPLLIGITGPPAARGDDLSDALARQTALAASVKAQQAEVARMRALQGGLAQEITSTRTALNGINANLQETQARVTKISADVAQVQAVYADLVTQVALLDNQVAAIEQEQANLAVQLEQRKNLLAARLREAYRTDRTPLVQTILTAGTFTDLLQDVGSYLDMGAQDRALADRIKADAAAADALHSVLLQTRSAREDLQAQTLAEKQQLDVQLASLNAAKARLVALQKATARQLAIQSANFARISKNKAALARLLAQNVVAQKKLSSQIAELVARQQALGNIPSAYNGTLQWPMAGLVTQEFGCTGFPSEPPVGSCAHFHQGIDLAAPMYTPIRAAGDGVVVFAGANPYDPYPQAWIVIIAHSDTLQTWYAHVDNGAHAPVVSAGDHVVAGQVIAYEGMTGNTTGPHLHWAVMFNGSFANPRLFV